VDRGATINAASAAGTASLNETGNRPLKCWLESITLGTKEFPAEIGDVRHSNRRKRRGFGVNFKHPRKQAW
jgi:hypothetical protein